MRRGIIAVLCLFTCASCSSLSVPASFRDAGQSAYCSILHVAHEHTPSSQAKPFLGITMKPATLENSGIAGCSGFVQVEETLYGSPAMKAGIKENDIILSVNDIPVCSGRENEDVLTLFKKTIAGQRTDTDTKITLTRNGGKTDIRARLANMVIERKPEASHADAGSCGDQPSLLLQELRAQDKLPLFNEIISGLDMQTNLIHNPDWLAKKPDNPYQLSEFTYMLRHPLMAGKVAGELAMRLTDASNETDMNIEEMVAILAQMLDVEYMHSAGCDDGSSLPGLIKNMENTYNRVNAVFKGLSPEEKFLLSKNAIEPWNSDKWNAIVELSLKIDLRELISALSRLLPCLTNDNLARLRNDLLERFKDANNPILYETNASFGKVIVGNTGPNIYREDAALILDLGGNDTYLNNAGGTRPGMPVALVIDWDGDDYYFSRENFSQAAGMMGGGFLIDMGGSDTFIGLDGSQGAGIYGIGLLVHRGGKSTFKSRSLSQGVGQSGIGLLWGMDKDSVYECGKYCQALGLFKGAGALIDDNGDDLYSLGGIEPDFRDPQHSTVSMGQGFGMGIRPGKDALGVSGGIGILIDKKGNDTYIADYFAQGSSYYYGIGILNDLSGDDRYIAGRYAQGAGIHSSAGVLIDNRGDDIYYASYGVAQGMGHDYGVGFLEDGQGNDTYTGGVLSQGAATIGGIGIMLDMHGIDIYTARGNSQAHANDKFSAGIMIDLEPAKDSGIIGNAMPVRIGIR